MEAACDFEPAVPPIGDKLMMINDQEKALLQLILDTALKSRQYRVFVTSKLGHEYIALGEKLLGEMKEGS
jgi:hypothetical protein